MNASLNYVIIVVALALIGGCTRQEDTSPRSNPFDANGSNWTIDSKPTIQTSVDSMPLWYDFDFSDTTGSIACRARIADLNGEKDTVSRMCLIGLGSKATDTVKIYADSAFIASRLKPATRYSYAIIARDKFDSTATATGSFVTPSGYPPRMTDSIVVDGDYSYIPIYWYNIDHSVTYLIYRSTALSGPFYLIADTTVSGSYSYGYYFDYVGDSRTYYYRLSTLNSYGECRSKKIGQGYMYSNSLSAPSSLYATQGSYSDCISLSWNAYSYSGSTFFIHRSTNSSGPYGIVDSTRANTYYYDTIKGAVSAYYYKVSFRNAQGQRSGPSSYAYGYVYSLAAPTAMATQGTYASLILVTWYYITNAAGYYVYRSGSPNGPFECVDTVRTAGNYTLTFSDYVKTTDNYYYKVAAYS